VFELQQVQILHTYKLAFKMRAIFMRKTKHFQEVVDMNA
jgi:hypothetical protein